MARSGRTRKATVELSAIGESGNPSYASWARYLAATLLEDRGEQDRAMALYEQVAAANDDATRTRSAPPRIRGGV